MRKTEAYRELLIGIACDFSNSNRGVDDYSAIEICELLDERGDGKYIPAWVVEDSNHMEDDLRERLLKQIREHEKSLAPTG